MVPPPGTTGCKEDQARVLKNAVFGVVSKFRGLHSGSVLRHHREDPNAVEIASVAILGCYNIQLSPTLLSKFDLIYLVLDIVDEQIDRCLVKHLVALYYDDPEDQTLDSLDLPTLTSYITYARQHIHPKISDEAAEDLNRGYVEMHRKGNSPGSSKKVITTTPHRIERLIRISEALSRIRFFEWVESCDVAEAFNLLEVALQQSATDHSTGTIDIDLITMEVLANERIR
ncbi:hypothetical protein SUGI_0413940 [Cryptomeria japonica]|nr:hypothetical protein SUGI_0413940 [Cryptomeria japonica]